jgi:hypothetical protein
MSPIQQRNWSIKNTTWYRSLLSPMQRTFADKFAKVDFDFWVKYGSWSFCDNCQSFQFDDAYFEDQILPKFDPVLSPDMPTEHCSGQVGASNRWWYRAGMYRPTHTCCKCTAPTARTAGSALIANLRAKTKNKQRPTAKKLEEGAVVDKTGQLYTIPYVRPTGVSFMAVSAECRTWPTYKHGKYHANSESETMLALSDVERAALQIIQLRCQIVKEKGNCSQPDDGTLEWS